VLTSGVAIAQTNLQLDRQLDRVGWPVDDRVRVAAAYDLAARLFTGQYRPNGKTFVAHVCGTASIAQLAGGTS
jgi:(p)ppGpp synthase/HD superfamily hydrolase